MQEATCTASCATTNRLPFMQCVYYTCWRMVVLWAFAVCYRSLPCWRDLVHTRKRQSARHHPWRRVPSLLLQSRCGQPLSSATGRTSPQRLLSKSWGHRASDLRATHCSHLQSRSPLLMATVTHRCSTSAVSTRIPAPCNSQPQPQPHHQFSIPQIHRPRSSKRDLGYRQLRRL